MFNPDIPFNELPLLPPKVNFDDVELLKLINKANNSLFELKGIANVLPKKSILISPFAIKEAVDSSGIENINTTVSEALKADVLYEKSELVGVEKEVLNYKDALIAGHILFLEQSFLNTNSFIKIQGILEPSKKGIRKIPGVKIQNAKTKKTVYTPPEGYDIILDKLKNFEIYFNEKEGYEDVDPLIRMGILHYQFEAIHPFLDGNGRTGRIFMVLYLVLTGRLDLPILFLSKYILKNRDEYYRKLNAVTAKGEWKEWLIYIIQAVDTQALATKVDILKIKDLMDDYKKISKSKPVNSSQEMIDYIFSNPFYTTSSMSKKLGIHRNTTRKYFKELENAGIVDKFKHKQGNIYYNQSFLNILSY